MTVTDKLTGIRITDHTGKISKDELQALLRHRAEQLKDHEPWLRREKTIQGPVFEPLYGLVVKPMKRQEDELEGDEPKRVTKRDRKFREGR